MGTFRRRSPIIGGSYWRNKQTWVVGGSSGLGCDIAVSLAAKNACLTIVGRDELRLAAIAQKLSDGGAASVRTLALDVSRQDAPVMLAAFAHQAAGIDLLVNAIGQSDRGDLAQLPSDELVELFRTNVVTSLHAVQGCLEALIKTRGCIVNIGSLSSKVAPAGLGGYSITKFGIAALSQQLRLELAEHGVQTLMVCPGPIRRSDSGKRYEQLVTKRNLDQSAAQPAGGARIRLIEPGPLTERILLAAQQRRCELVVPSKVRWLAALAQLWPAMADRFLRHRPRVSRPIR